MCTLFTRILLATTVRILPRRRLNIAYTDMMPAVRHGLFSEST
jgi:hypothetical protein